MAEPDDQYFDADGHPCALDVLCKKEPAWAANRIRAERKRVVELEDRPGPKVVEGGIDHGTMWEGISIGPQADPKSVAMGLQDSFNEGWLRLLVKHLDLEICEACSDPTCEGHGATVDPYDFTHASGECICTVCGMEYRAHDDAKDIPGYDGGAFLTRLCDGRLVKL